MADSKNKVIIDLEVDGGKNLNKFQQGIKDIGETSKKVFDGIGNGLNKVGPAFKAIGSAGKKAFDGIGMALKGAGIGLVIGLFTTLWEALKKNQKVMDGVNTAINAMGVVIKPVIDGVVKLVENFSKNNKAMDALTSVAKNLIKVGLTPIKLAFDGIKLVIDEVQLGWLKLKDVFGDVDSSKIKELEDNIKSTKESLKSTTKDAGEAVKGLAKDIPTAFNESSKIIKTTVNGVIDDYSNLSVKSALAAGKAIDNASKNIERLNIEHEKMKMQYENEEELLRQIRDDSTKSYEERSEASKQLTNKLKEQEDAEKKIIQQKIANQQILLAQDKNNVENKNKLAELNNQLIEVEKRINEQRSEQKTSEVSLNQEKVDNEKATADAIAKIKQDTVITADKTAKQIAIDEENIRYKAGIDEINALKIKETEKYSLIEAQNKLHQHNLNKIETDSAKETAEELAKVKLFYQNKTAEELAIQAEEDAYNQQVKAIQALQISEAEKNDLLVASALKTAENIKKIKADADKEESEKTEKERQEKLNKDLEYTQQLTDATLEIVNQGIELQLNKETEAQNKKYVQRLNDINNLKISEEEKNKLKEKAEKDNAKALAKIEEKAAKQKDKAAKAEILINAALAIVKTWSGYASMGVAGAILAGVQTVAIGVTAGAQISAVDQAAAERQGGSYANGGIIPGSSYTGDKLSANVNSGEMILNQEQQAKLFNQVNSGGDSYMNAEMIAQAVIKAIQSIPVVITEQAITEKQKEVKIRESRFSY